MRQCAEISRALEVLSPGPTMAHLCCHSRGPTKREKPAGCPFFPARQRRAPFTVAKKSPWSPRRFWFIHLFGGSITRRRERDRSRRLNDDEKSKSKNRACTIRLSAFRPAQRRPVLFNRTIARNESKEPFKECGLVDNFSPLKSGSGRIRLWQFKVRSVNANTSDVWSAS